jgi:hypothetical protein
MGGTPLVIQAGVSYPAQEMREALDADWGYYAGLDVLITDQRAILGWPSTDIDVRWHKTEAGRMVSIATFYAERARLSDRTQFGFGIGAVYGDVNIPAGPTLPEGAEEKKWGLGAKAMAGYQLTGQLFLEGAFHYTGEVGGLSTNGVTLGLGFWL